MKRIWVIFFVVVICAGFGYVMVRNREGTSQIISSNIQSTPKNERRVEIRFPNGIIELADLADTNMERVQGLSHRENPQSMLFIFPQASSQVFWMKDMQFAIDFIWIHQNTIVGITENALPEDPAVTLYSSPIPVDRVLEVPAGLVKMQNLTVGDVLDIPIE